MFILKLRRFFCELNLFRNPYVINNRHQIKNQYISTRIFILTFPIILLSVILYLSLSSITMTTSIEGINDELFRKLHYQYNDTLKCPCSNLSIPYQSFVSITTTFHPICSVDFDPLINALFKYTESLSNHHDFRFTAALQFRLLIHLCFSAKEILRTRLIDFNNTLFVDIFLLDETNFHSRVKQLIDGFFQIIINDFISSLQIIRVNTFINQFISGIHSNYKIIGERRVCRKKFRSAVYSCHWEFTTHSEKYARTCDCSSSFSCFSPAIIYDNNKTFIVNGFQIGCYVVESLLSSSLECFYNMSCLNQLLYYIELNTSIILQPSKKFHATDSIELLINELFVDDWYHSVDYKAYFTACQVRKCTYSYEDRRSILLIATTIVSVIGGLTTTLFCIIPIIIKFIRKQKTVRIRTVNHQNTIHRLPRLFNRQKLIKRIRLINLFKSVHSRTEFDIQNEFLSTRIYIILLLIILCISIEYHITSMSIKTLTIQTPSFNLISNINESSLKCSCSMITISFKTFIRIQPRFHPICSSDFVNQTLLNTINTTNNYEAEILQKRFYILSLFCQLSKQTLEFALDQLDNTHFLSPELIFENQFQTKINEIINQTIAVACSTFNTFINLMIDTNTINNLLSNDAIFQPSGAWSVIDLNKPVLFFNKIDHTFDNRKCIFSNQLGNITFDQFYTNCNVLQALMSSSLLSFYNIIHVKLFHNYIQNILYRPLEIPTNYLKNATIAYILNTLMVDTYTKSISYENYFKKCKTQTCTYKKESQESFIDIILTMIGFIGGIMGILHVFIKIVVQFLRNIIRKTNRNISQRRNFWNFINSQYKKIYSINTFGHFNDLKRNQIISTRIFLILFLIILIILTFYTSLTFTERFVEINQPSYNKFLSLNKQYSSSNLICSCSNIYIPYRTFLSFSPKFHQICSSVFSQTRFLDLLVHQTILLVRFYDYRQFSWEIFTAIRVFCDLSRKTVEEQVNIFLSATLISNQVLSEEQLQAHIEPLIQAMIQVSQQKINILIKLIRDVTYANQIVSNSFTNLNVEDLDLANETGSNRTIGLTNKRYGNCNCLTSSSCIIPAITQDNLNPRFSFDGFFIGCYILDSVLLSSMKCLYSQKCIDRAVVSAMNVPLYATDVFPSALNPNENSSYTVNTTFSDLFAKLMLETWNQKLSHSFYYQSCNVSSCTYTFIVRREFTYITTILFGIIGGLNKVLRVIVPRFVSFTMKILYRNKVTPTAY
ncbi:unnamed protein product [Adineta ricciae]|uniref:Uncharacterized protein n=1 Tax=Adineta ricciae TaxID=249248 RepID=A0A815M1U5_ADIRI|nr:unnamed protein product [Adineta ricciae]